MGPLELLLFRACHDGRERDFQGRNRAHSLVPSGAYHF